MRSKKGRMRSKNENKRAQVTIFVILAILIVAVLIIAFYPNIKKVFSAPNPGEFIAKSCIADNVKPIFERVMLRGGSLNPELYFMYNNESVDYLCYTSEWYKTCLMQKPLLKQSIESEVEKSLQSGVNKCVADMENRLKLRGYSVSSSGTKKLTVSIVPDKVILSLDLNMIVEKGDTKESYSNVNFKTSFNSGSYELIMVASSIQNFEARYGDSTPETYMSYYPNIKVEKLKQSDGTKVYILTDRESKEKLQFATRSLAWPPGYAL